MADDEDTLEIMRGTLEAGTLWRLCLVGKADTDPGSSSDGSDLSRTGFRAAQVVVKEGDAGTDRIVLRLAAQIEIPRGLIKFGTEKPQKPRVGTLKTAAEIETELGSIGEALRHNFEAMRAETIRRLTTLEVDTNTDAFVFFGVAGPLGSAGVRAGAQVKLHIGAIVGQLPDEPAFDVVAELALLSHAEIQSPVGPIRRTLAVTCVLRDKVAPSLRIDLDDLNIGLPEFKLPAFSFDVPFMADLAGSGNDKWKGAARALRRLAPDVTVVFDNAVPEPMLAMRVRPGGAGLDWAIVAAPLADADWAQSDFGGKLAALSVTINHSGGQFARVTDLRLADRGAGPCFASGTVTLGTQPMAVPDGRKRIGPLEVSWKGVRIAPAASIPVKDGAGHSVRAEVAFERLELRVHDDPDAVLAFRGAVELTPTGARVLKLDLVAPYPIALVAEAAGALARQTAAIVRVVADFANAAAEQVEKLLDILARIAAAVGRAALYVAGEALQKAGGLLAKALVSVSELVGEILRALSELAKDNASSFAVELRIGTDPFELRQVLVTLRASNGGGASKDRKIRVLGMSVDITGGWQPGLLVDVANQPGAYLVLTRPEADQGKAIATVSTDLWLNRKEAADKQTNVALRDADGGKGKPGERADDPLVRIDLKLRADAPKGDLVVVLAGLNRGKGIFLKRLSGQLAPVTAPNPVPGTLGVKLKTCEGPFALADIDQDHFDIAFSLRKDRVLPLLGMGEPGKEANTDANGPSFLKKLQASLSNVIWVKETRTSVKFAERKAELDLVLGLKAAGLETAITLGADLSLDTLEMSFDASKSFPIVSRRVEERALGLVWVVEQTCKTERLNDAPVDMFLLAFVGGQSCFELNKAKARMELRFEDLSSDGKGVVFEVDTFKIGPSGLDLKGFVKQDPVRLNGIDVPFKFTTGSLEIRGGKLVSAAIAGRGSLPPKLIGEADCTVALTFGADAAGGGIVLQAGKVELDKKGDPIICHASRFTLTITDLDIAFVKDGGYHFYYLVTGSLRFTPKSGEFESGLLQYLDGVEMNLERTPLSADARVLLKHISFQKALNPKKSFNLFNLFTFELRGFGYHPASPKFGGEAAVNISGQIKFVEIGDVMQPKIDFHGLWIAPPAKGESLPRIKADGLGIDLNLKGAIKVRGEVIAVDPETRTVEGHEFVPEGYDAYGFLGRGEFEIPGWGNLGANLGFLELERQDRPGERRKSFYFYAEKRKLAIEIPTPIWTFYLREAGFGLGFRYTLEALSAADKAPSIPKLIRALDDVSKRQGDLHKFSAWRPEPEGDRVTLALKGAIQTYPAEKTWNEESEEAAQNPFLFDLVAAIRSDFTLFMGLRGWLGTNYIDYLNDKDGLRSKPGLQGYLYVSAPQKRLLARMIADSKGYIGERIPALKRDASGGEPPLRRALRAVDWSATLFIKPGLFHYELGWPDQLAVRLIEEPNMRVTVRGGMIFRAAEDGLLWGYNIEADAFFRFGGQVQIGPVGVSAEASLQARLVARVISYLSWRFKGSLIYGLISLDATLAVSFRAWMKIDLGFKSFTIRIGFSLSLQFSAAIEMVISTSGIGARVHARVGVSVFGRTLSVGVGFAFGGAQLEEARARVQRFMAMSITAEEPDSAPHFTAKMGDERIAADAAHAAAPSKAPPVADVIVANPDGKVPDERAQRRAVFGRPIPPTDFWLVMHAASFDPAGKPATAEHVYAMLVPKEPIRVEKDGTWRLEPNRGGFYAAPYASKATFEPAGARDEATPVHRLEVSGAQVPLLQSVLRHVPGTTASENQPARNGVFAKLVTPGTKDQDIPISVRWNAPVSADNGGLTLAHVFDECFLSDTEWLKPDRGAPYRVTTAWTEPSAAAYAEPTDLGVATDQEKVAARDRAQRARDADALTQPIVEAVHQARSTMLAMFMDQFTNLAMTGVHSSATAHVTDLGLVFYGPVDEVLQLENASVFKLEGVPGQSKGSITVLNRRDLWFDRQDPVLSAHRSAIATDGIKLDWRLALPFALNDPGAAGVRDPEHFLHHYEIIRTIEGQEFMPLRVRVKPAATIGGKDKDNDGFVSQIRPDWQFVDDLADLKPDLRRALLPASDEAGVLASATAWVTQLGAEDALSITYSVTPVDIAGVRGLPKSFLVEVQRPQAPVRPAEAELRFVVRRMTARQGDAPHLAPTPPDKSLGVVMSLRDPVKGTDPRIRRSYRLVADPDDIRPSGHYGTDGLTDRRLGPASGFGPTAAALVWALDAEGFKAISGAGSELSELEPDEEVRKKFPRWRALAGNTGLAAVDKWLSEVVPPGGGAAKPPNPPVLEDPHGKSSDFLARLWRRDGKDSGPRIATRFALETVQVILDAKGTEIARSVSKRVPVAIEVRVEPLKDERVKPPIWLGEIGLSRPEAFEWPVHMEMPAHRKGQIQAETGFARFQVPPGVAGSLAGLLSNPRLMMVRDPERQVLTQIQFDAAARFDETSQPAIDPIHGSAVAGYDLHELDIDDLARRDTDATPFARNAKTWRRARRVARIERVSAEMSRLLPDANNDWMGWQAHYPSETWRLQERRRGMEGQSKPIRAPWYSAAESTLHFAERNPRLRLQVTAPELAVSELLAGGEATELLASLKIAPPAEPYAWLAKAMAAVPLRLCRIDLGASRPDDGLGFEFSKGECRIFKKPGAPDGVKLSPAQIRAALLRLAWAPDGKISSEFRARPHLFDGLSVEIKGRSPVLDWKDEPKLRRGEPEMRVTGTASLPVPLGSVRHPLLDEVLGELEYGATATTLYRRYVVTPQTVQPSEDKQFGGFLAAHAPEKDPYGWAALQSLGLATTIKMYDRDEDRFLDGQELLARVNAAMGEAVHRHRDAFEAHGIGQPFVEVLLKPGRDRALGPFDAVLSNSSIEDEPGHLDLSDDTLAIAQLSLRPTAIEGRSYARLDLGWEKAVWPSMIPDKVTKEPPVAVAGAVDPEAETTVAETTVTVTRIIRGYDLVFPKGDLIYEVIRSADGYRLSVTPREDGRVAALVWPKDKVSAVQPDASLLFMVRHATGRPFDPATLKVEARLLKLTTKRTRFFRSGTSLEAQSPHVEQNRQEEVVSLADLKTLLGKPANFPEHGLRRPAADPKTKPEGEALASQPIRDPAGSIPSPYGQFSALKPDEWTAMTVADPPLGKVEVGTPTGKHTNNVVAGLDSLRQNLRFAAPSLVWPRDDKAPDFDDFQPTMATYLNWCQRFLDHGAGPADTTPVLFALAAPIKAQPWHLAADRAGRITLSFLHSDRWAHARAYAVRPTGRYQNLALGAGYYHGRQEDSERLVTSELLAGTSDVFAQEVGYAVAVSPRTEKIEPPVILGTALTRRADGMAWELVVARHGEEALAFSNRSLFARLGTEGTALSFVRAYREPQWPRRLQNAGENGKDGKAPLPEPMLYPMSGPELPKVVPQAPTGIDGAALGALAHEHPSLWKGADIWRIGGLPPHYRVTVLAAARAGLVVSNIVTAVQDATPRRPLDPRQRLALSGISGNDPEKRTGPEEEQAARIAVETAALLGTPELVIGWDGQSASLELARLRLVSHQDLSEVAAPQHPDDVAWWPDPDLTYTLLRHGTREEGGTFEDEDAVIRLVARPDPAAEQALKQAEPVVVRCRGTRYAAAPSAAARPAGLPIVTSAGSGASRDFQLGVRLVPDPKGPAAGERLTRFAGDTLADWPRFRQAFNTAARGKEKAGFAEIIAEHEIEVLDPTDLPNALDQAKEWLRRQAKKVEAVSSKLQAEMKTDEFVPAFEEIAGELRAEADALTTIDPFEVVRARLTRPRRRMIVLRMSLGTDSLHVPEPGLPLTVTARWQGEEVLAIRGLPPKDIAMAVEASGHPVASRVDGRLWTLCREQLLGAATDFVVRAVDTRNAIEKTPSGVWTAPGEISTKVTLPVWTTWGR